MTSSRTSLDFDRPAGAPLEPVQAPPISLCRKIGMGCMISVTITLLALTILTGMGKLDLDLTALICATSILGGLQVIGIIRLICHQRNLKKQLERSQLLEEDIDEVRREDLLENSDPPPVAQAPPRPLKPEYDLASWKNHLETTVSATDSRSINLDDPDEPVAQIGNFGMAQLPLLGSYNRGKSCYDPTTIVMAVKLPSTHIGSFPRRVINMLTREERSKKPIPPEKQNIDCLFVVYDNTSRGLEGNRRNLALHPIAFHQYNQCKPEQIPKDSQGLQKRSGGSGLSTAMKIGMFHPRGVNPGMEEDARAIPKDAYHYMSIEIHNGKEELPRLSPNNAYFDVDTRFGVSSVYFGVKLNTGRSVAIHALIVNNWLSADGMKLATAAKMGLKIESDMSFKVVFRRDTLTISEFISTLEIREPVQGGKTEGRQFSFLAEVKETFALPDNSPKRSRRKKAARRPKVFDADDDSTAKQTKKKSPSKAKATKGGSTPPKKTVRRKPLTSPHVSSVSASDDSG